MHVCDIMIFFYACVELTNQPIQLSVSRLATDAALKRWIFIFKRAFATKCLIVFYDKTKTIFFLLLNLKEKKLVCVIFVVFTQLFFLIFFCDRSRNVG